MSPLGVTVFVFFLTLFLSQLVSLPYRVVVMSVISDADSNRIFLRSLEALHQRIIDLTSTLEWEKMCILMLVALKI